MTFKGMPFWATAAMNASISATKLIVSWNWMNFRIES